MKKLLLLLCLAATVTAKSQVYQIYPQYGGEWNRLHVKTALGVPNDTFAVPASKLLFPHLAMKGDSLYYWSVPLQRYVLHQSGGSGGTPSVVYDSLKVANVVNYGAIPNDGLSDQTAFAAAKATGWDIWVPSGIYDSVQISLDTNQHIYGLTGKSILNIPAGYTTLTLNENSGVHGIQFVGTGMGSHPSANTDFAPNQVGVKLFKNKNRVQYCTFINVNGAGVYGYNTTTVTSYWRDIMFYPDISDNDFQNCTIGVQFRLQWEYSHTLNNTFKGCRIGIFERNSANHTYSNNHIDSCGEGLRVANYCGYNCDHSTLTGGSINHSSVYALNFESLGAGYVVSGVNIYYGEIGVGTVATANNLLIANCGLGLDTITAVNTTIATIRDCYYFSTITRSGTGITYFNNIGTASTNSSSEQQYILNGGNTLSSSQSGNIGYINSRDLNFITNNSTRMMIDSSSGNVGIGTISPDSLLTIIGGGLYVNRGVRFTGFTSTSNSADSMLVVNVLNGNLGYRAIPSGGGGGGGIGGSTGSTDNAILRADGTGGATLQAGATATLADDGTGTFNGVVVGTYGGNTGISKTGTDMYFVVSAGALIYQAGSAGMRIEITDAGAKSTQALQYGGNFAYVKMGSNMQLFGSAGYTSLGAAGTTDVFAVTSTSAGLGTTAPAASAKLEIVSTTKGFLPPRMTGTQAEAISSPAEGLMIYSTDGSGSVITSKGWWGYDGSTWVKLN